MINWRYVVPRMLLLAAAVAAIWLGLDPLLRFAITTFGSRALGTRVDIGSLQTSLAGTSVRLENIQIASPSSPLSNLIEAQTAVLDLEADSLLKKKLVIREGRLSGIKFGSQRTSSGALPEKGSSGKPGTERDIGTDKFAGIACDWLKHSADALRKDLEQELESVRIAKELLQRWPAEYEQLAARADVLSRRIKELKKLLDNAEQGGLKSLEAYRQAAIESDAIHSELLDLRDKLKQFPKQAQRDKQALLAAEQRDVEHLRRKFLLDNLDADTLAQYLLGPEQGRQVDELIAWIKWARQLTPAETSAPEPTRGRGTTVLFPGFDRTPDFLVRSLKLDGEAKVGQELVKFAGDATGLTTQPKIFGEPARFTLRTGGATPMTIAATLDRTGTTPHDTLQIVCPKIEQPRRVLGNPEQLAVAVSPGAVQLRVQLELRADVLSGRATLVQEPVELTPTLAANLGGERLARGMAAAMHNVRRLDAVVEMSGTLDQPQWKLSSSLGHEVASGVERAFQQELDTGREELAKQAEQYIDGQVARLDGLLAAKEQELAAKLNVGDQELTQLSRQVAARTGMPGGLRTPKLPGADLFRR